MRKQRTPEDLIKSWMGHAKSSVTDAYSKVAEDVDFRLEVAEQVGTGFAVPANTIPMVPRKTAEKEIEAAA